MSAVKGCFVTGTDTGIGKTVVATMLCLRWGAHYWKPVQSGRLPATDSEFVQSFIGKEKICPETYLFKNPLSPNQAASLENIEIDLERLHLPQSSPLVVEGAGGVMVPLNRDYQMIELIKKFNLPAVIVARSELGTLNHTFLTLQALRLRQIDVMGVVLVGPENELNRKSIAEIGDVKILCEIPRVREITLSWMQEMATRMPILKMN